MLSNLRRAEIKLNRFWQEFLNVEFRKLNEKLESLPTNNLYVSQKLVKDAWTEFMDALRAEFYNYRFESAALAYGQLSEQHAKYFNNVSEANYDVTTFPPLFEDQIDEILERVAKQRWGDGKNLKDRVKKHDKAILGALLSIAYLRNSQETKPEYADTLGHEFKNGAYYQLARLSHNEFKAVLNEATNQVNSYAPWVVGEKVNLSSTHPPIGCECEQVAGGVYEIGEINLPIHPNCNCYKTPVSISQARFKELWNGDSWPEMNRYQHWVGVNRSALINTSLFAGADSILQKWLNRSVEVV